MKNIIAIMLILSILILNGCRNTGPAEEIRPNATDTNPTSQTDSENDKKGPVISDPQPDHDSTESVLQTEGSDETKPQPTTSTRDNNPEGSENQNESGKHSDDQSNNSQTEPVKPTDPPVTRPAETQPAETEPFQTQPKKLSRLLLHLMKQFLKKQNLLGQSLQLPSHPPSWTRK